MCGERWKVFNRTSNINTLATRTPWFYSWYGTELFFIFCITISTSIFLRSQNSQSRKGTSKKSEETDGWVTVKSLSLTCCFLVAKLCLTLFVTPWPIAHQALLLYPWDFPGKDTVVVFHFLLQGIFLTQGWNQHLLHWQVGSLTLSHQEWRKSTLNIHWKDCC